LMSLVGLQILPSCIGRPYCLFVVSMANSPMQRPHPFEKRPSSVSIAGTKSLVGGFFGENGVCL
jgi:hypothetical protein